MICDHGQHKISTQILDNLKRTRQWQDSLDKNLGGQSEKKCKATKPSKAMDISEVWWTPAGTGSSLINESFRLEL